MTFYSKSHMNLNHAAANLITIALYVLINNCICSFLSVNECKSITHQSSPHVLVVFQTARR